MSDTLQTHFLGAGVIVLRNEEVLLVKDNNGWCFPKGGVEPGELFHEAARREFREETGMEVSVKDTAFITEFRSKQWGLYLQVYFSGEIEQIDISLDRIADNDITEIKFVTIKEAEKLIDFKPWVEPFKEWVKVQNLRHYKFDMD